MPWSPKQLTMASFLKKPPDPSPSGPSPPNRKGKHNKRKLSISPNSANATSKKPNIFPITSSNEEFPPLPENPSPKPKPLIYDSSTNAISLSRMDSSLIDMEAECEEFSIPTSEEADALLKDDDPPLCDDAASSPTAAVRSAIEAQIAENLDTLTIVKLLPKNAVNKDVSLPPTLAPFVPPSKKPQPLFPEGLPPFVSAPNSGPHPSSSNKAKGYFTVHAGGPVAPPSGNSNTKPTYATKTKSPQKTRDLVQNILYVYSTKVSKRPLTPGGWGVVDGILLDKITSQDPNDPTLVRIANSGYDASHRCGFVACRDPASEAWVKTALRDSAYRAWSKGEQPEVRLCRVFLPARFDSLDEDQLIPLVLRHNPALKDSSLSLQSFDMVQRGRAFILEMDSTSYSYVKSKNHKLEFVMMDIDCQPYIPAVKKAPRVEGITKLDVINKVATPSQVASSSSRHSPNNGQSKPDSASAPNDSLNKSFTEKFVEERKKRIRTENQLYQDSAKKKDAA